MKPMISVSNYTKKNSFTAVDDVSFDVEEGSIFFLIQQMLTD